MQIQSNYKFKKIFDQKNLKGKKILLRLDLNVPIVGDSVRDDFRIKRSLPTLNLLRERGAKTIIISHIDNQLTDSLSQVSAYISKLIPIKKFVEKFDDASTEVSTMRDGDIIILENLRENPGEKSNDPVFAGRLSALADYYVNDAFAVSHREHASIVSVPKLIPSFAGPLLADEVEKLSMAFNPSHPFLFILGGAKFDTKLPLIEKFLGIADNVFVCGALANDIYRERGYEVGLSTVAKARINLKQIEMNPKLLVPEDVIVSSTLERIVKNPGHVGPNEKIMDAGPRSIDQIKGLLKNTKFVLWNGPLGEYENGFAEGTENLARVIADNSVSSDIRSVVGGGDTVAIVARLGILDKFTFASTGGGAMIEFLAQGTLPGIEALDQV